MATLRFVPTEAQAMVAECEPAMQKELARIYREHADRRGSRGEIALTPPQAGSRRYPWLKRRPKTG